MSQLPKSPRSRRSDEDSETDSDQTDSEYNSSSHDDSESELDEKEPRERGAQTRDSRPGSTRRSESLYTASVTNTRGATEDDRDVPSMPRSGKNVKRTETRHSKSTIGGNATIHP